MLFPLISDPSITPRQIQMNHRPAPPKGVLGTPFYVLSVWLSYHLQTPPQKMTALQLLLHNHARVCSWRTTEGPLKDYKQFCQRVGEEPLEAQAVPAFARLQITLVFLLLSKQSTLGATHGFDCCSLEPARTQPDLT